MQYSNNRDTQLAPRPAPEASVAYIKTLCTYHLKIQSCRCPDLIQILALDGPLVAAVVTYPSVLSAGRAVAFSAPALRANTAALDFSGLCQ